MTEFGRDLGSLRRRLLAWLLASTAALGSLAVADTWREARRAATTLSDRVLAGAAFAIAERVFVDIDGRLAVEVPYSALEMLTSTAQDRVFYRVDGPGGGNLTGYADLPLAGEGEGELRFADVGYAGERVRIVTLEREAVTGIDALPFAVTVAETTRSRQQLTRSLLLHSALRTGAMILGAAAAVWVVVTLALRPLDTLARALAARPPGDLSPLRADAPSEVWGLVQAVNGVMARLGASMEALRNFTGNASHQLRTPLAVVRAQLAVASREEVAVAAKEAIQDADAAVAEAERVLAQLLLLARLDASAGTPPDDLMDLRPLVRDLTAEQVPRAARAGIDLGFDGGPEPAPLPVRADAVLLREMLRNLLDNALAYAGSGAEVTVRLRGEAGRATLEVEDDGPGLPPDCMGLVLRRFGRGREEGPTGLGLGLPIAEEIARRFGGRLTLGPGRSGRGLRVVVAFPQQD